MCFVAGRYFFDSPCKIWRILNDWLSLFHHVCLLHLHVSWYCFQFHIIHVYSIFFLEINVDHQSVCRKIPFTPNIWTIYRIPKSGCKRRCFSISLGPERWQNHLRCCDVWNSTGQTWYPTYQGLSNITPFCWSQFQQTPCSLYLGLSFCIYSLTHSLTDPPTHVEFFSIKKAKLNPHRVPFVSWFSLKCLHKTSKTNGFWKKLGCVSHSVSGFFHLLI